MHSVGLGYLLFPYTMCTKMAGYADCTYCRLATIINCMFHFSFLFRFQCYKARDTATAGQSSITSFMQSPKPGALGGNAPTYYSPKSAQAQAIHESIMMDLVVGESLPLRIVESQGFLNFMQTVDPRYKPTKKRVKAPQEV